MMAEPAGLEPVAGPPGLAAVSVPRAARVSALRLLVGSPDPTVAQLTLGIRSVAHRHFDRHVLPLVDAHWPALRAQRFYRKLRIGACDLYASASYTALFCSPEPPLLVRAVTRAGSGLPLSNQALAILGRGAIEALGRLAYADAHRRIALVSAFIVVADQVFDHCMLEPAEERGDKLIAIIDGRAPPASSGCAPGGASPDGPELALVRALTVAMGDGLVGDERLAFEAALERVRAWIRAEVRAMLGVPDPSGLGHRLAGVEGTIDGLLFPVARFASPAIRAWMYDVSMFVQVMDDWLDYEVDVASGRPTPVTEGAWTHLELEAAWRRTLVGIDALVRAAGLGSPHYIGFLRHAYVLMMHEIMEAMVSGLAA